MSFPVGSQVAPQASPSEIWLRFPDNIGVHAQISYEQAIGLLTQAIELSQRVPFTYSYIDQPPDGQAYLTFLPQNTQAIPPDGIRWLDQEKSYRMPIPAGRELEVSEVKFGFVPGAEPNANRVRRRFRLTKGGNPQLMLLHYLRGDTMAVPLHLLQAQVRSYPLRPLNEMRIYVAGERMGQRIPVSGAASLPVTSPPHPVHGAQPNGVGVNMGLGLGIGGINQAVALAQQNQAMDALERERRSRTIPTMPAGVARPPDEEESGDEFDDVSTRALAVERFKRNHELMAEVFTYASKGIRTVPIQPSPYASLDLNELNEKVAKLTAEIEQLKAQAEDRRITREAAEMTLAESHEAVEAPLIGV